MREKVPMTMIKVKDKANDDKEAKTRR